MADSKDSKDITTLVEVEQGEDQAKDDAVLEHESDSGVEQPAADREKPRKDASQGKPKSWLALFTFLLLIMAIAAAAAGGYYLWQQQQQLIGQQAENSQRLQQQFSQLQNRTGNLDLAIKANSNKMRELEQNQQRIGEIAQQAISVTNRSQRDWILAEVDYLIRLAGRRLEVARDIDSAAAALKAADDRIYELGDLNLLPIRKQLAKDIGTLKSIQQADVNGTALALDQMIELVGDLPFKSVQDEVAAQLENNGEPKPAEAQQQDEGFVDSVLNTVKSIGDIKIRHRSIEPASSAQQQLQIEQILRTHLLGARLAVLRYDQAQFIHDIQQAQQILHLHYREQDNRVSQMLTDLNQFATLNLQPELPGISTAWNMLQKEILRSRLDPEAQPEPKAKPPAQSKPSGEVKS